MLSASGMLIHRQNSYAPLVKLPTGRREAQNRGTGQESKNHLCIFRFWVRAEMLGFRSIVYRSYFKKKKAFK
jgi:hypothetical protein